MRFASQHVCPIPLTIARLSVSMEDEASDGPPPPLDWAVFLLGCSPEGPGGAVSALLISSRVPSGQPQTPPR